MTKTELPEIPIATHSFRQRYLYAFATRAEIVNHVRTQCLDEERNRLDQILNDWQNLQPRVAQIMQNEADRPETVQVKATPQECQSTLERIASDSLFQKTFSSLPITFALVEVDKLVAPQRTVHLGYVERLSATYPKSPTVSELLEICVSPKRKMDPIQHLEIGPNTHVFSSPNSDVRFLGAFVKELTEDDLNYAVMGGVPAAAIIAFIGYGGAPINVLKAGNRIVLNNGFHRVYALRSIGVREIPVVVQMVQNPQLEFPLQVAGLPKEYLLNVPRPVLLKDFFEPDFAITLKVRERMRTVTVSIALNQYDVPA